MNDDHHIFPLLKDIRPSLVEQEIILSDHPPRLHCLHSSVQKIFEWHLYIRSIQHVLCNY